jgi:uncharacterized protein
MRKSDPRQNIALIIVVILAILVGIAILIQKEKEQGKPQPPKPRPIQLPRAQLPIFRQAFPELLIKGCLFDLGFARQDVHFLGETVKVTMHRPLSQDQISRAFAPINKIGRVQIENERHVRIVIDEKSWDIFFSGISEKMARCAIIIDDMGTTMETAEVLGRIDADLTFSVLPDTPDTQKVARFLHRRGREILLHLPMQGNGKDPGPGAILQGMQPSQISEVLKQDLESVPYIAGVNNHMGSVITADPEAMRLILGELKNDGLFFVDSLTTNMSVCGRVAHELKVPFIARDVFLDNERNSPYITSQVEKLVKISLKYSNAVGICHPHPETIAVLEREIPRMKRLGVEIVKVSALMNSSGGAGSGRQ